MQKSHKEEKQKAKFSDPIIDKYKDLQNIKHLGASEEFFELQKYVANLIYKFSCNKYDLLFNAYYYEDLFKVIRMFIARERDKTICSDYQKRLVTVAITVDVAEEYFINEELSKEEADQVFLKRWSSLHTKRTFVGTYMTYQDLQQIS